MAADLIERAACLRAAIRATTEALEGKHQDGKLAIQLREHLAHLQKMEREMLGADAPAAPALPTLGTEAAMLERVAAAVPSPHDMTLCGVATRLRARAAGVPAGRHETKPPSDAAARATSPTQSKQSKT